MNQDRNLALFVGGVGENRNFIACGLDLDVFRLEMKSFPAGQDSGPAQTGV